MSDEQQPATADGLGPEPGTPTATEASVAVSAEGVAVPADGAAVETATATAESVTATATEPAAAATEPAAAAAIPADPVISRVRRRGLAVVAGLTRVLRFAFVVALFAVGVAFGYQSFLNQAQVTAAPGPDPATAGNQPAPVIRELIAAVGTNDADRIRAAMPNEPYKLFTSEMQRWEFKEVTSVETLATFEDGTRTATSFVMLGRDLAGNPIAMTIVAETKDGNIVGFK